MKVNKENSVEKIIIKYDDGTQKEILKGAIITSIPSDSIGENTLTFEFANIQGIEVINLILGTVQMGVELGLFDEK